MTDMLTGYRIWDDNSNVHAGYATVEHLPDGHLVDVEVISCTIPNGFAEQWVATTHNLCNELSIAGVVFHHQGGTVTIRECTPF